MKNLLVSLIFIISSSLIYSQEEKNDTHLKENTLIKKSFDSFKSDIKTISKNTAKWDITYANKVSHDVIKFAAANYIKSVDITLLNSNDIPLKVAKYYVHVKSNPGDKYEETSEKWPNIKNSSLAVVLHYSSLWHNLTVEQKTTFLKKNNFKIAWIDSNIDSSYAHLEKH